MSDILYPVIDVVKTGENIKRLQEERDIKADEIQRFLGLAGPQAVYQWQRGENLPSTDHLLALSHLFGVSINKILVIATLSKELGAEEIKPSKKVPKATKLLLLLVV